MTSSNVTLAVDSLCPSLSSGLPIIIFPLSGQLFPVCRRPRGQLCGKLLVDRNHSLAMKLLVGFPTLQKYCKLRRIRGIGDKTLRTVEHIGAVILLGDEAGIIVLSEPARFSKTNDASRGFSTKGAKTFPSVLRSAG